MQRQLEINSDRTHHSVSLSLLPCRHSNDVLREKGGGGRSFFQEVTSRSCYKLHCIRTLHFVIQSPAGPKRMSLLAVSIVSGARFVPWKNRCARYGPALGCELRGMHVTRLSIKDTLFIKRIPVTRN
jgi:hypothetical protein